MGHVEKHRRGCTAPRRILRADVAQLAARQRPGRRRSGGLGSTSTWQKSTYVEQLSGLASLATVLPLADKLVAGDARGGGVGGGLLGRRAYRLLRRTCLGHSALCRC